MRASVILSQNGNTVLEYTDESESLSIKDNELTLHLTPEETGKFNACEPNAFAIAQINLIYEKDRHATRPVRIPIRANLKPEAM